MNPYIIAVVVGIAGALIIGMNIGTTPEDLDAFEDCIQEQYGMSAVEYYQMTDGDEPVCNK